MKNLKKKFDSAVTTLVVKAQNTAHDVTATLKSDDGQFVVDHALVFVIGVAVAAVVLGLVITFVQDDLAPGVTDKILGFMN